jgi:hypothetical protein
MDNEANLPEELREPLRRMAQRVDHPNALIRNLFEKGEQNDLELLVDWLRNQFIKPVLYGLEEETSGSRLENLLAHLHKGSARLREALPETTTPTVSKFAERWNSEMNTAISSIQERLRKLDDSTP